MRQLKITRSVTNRETVSLDKYLHEIGQQPMITPEEEVVLAQRIRQGDHEALRQLTLANLRFVISVSKQYQNQGLSLPDLINEGNLGLIKAAQRFDETRGFKFISYAVWWIRQSILQALAEQARIVRLPLNRISTINKLLRLISELEQKLERLPQLHEIAGATELTEKDVVDLLRNVGRHASIDAPLAEDEDTTMLDTLQSSNEQTPEAALIRESLRIEINRFISTLTHREAEILRLFFGLSGSYPLTLDEIGERYNMSREGVRQIKERAIHTLKQNSKCFLLRSYL
ncbi:MAG: RNA polymerase sigma factor RpoD/SigA [Bacteroidales bacterium]|jgi:RNA polymerase primary sigma factor|nr:RNA polymerase sigma factor RpoD/SigA [Bacteroidales bacterium]NCU36663.1 RNA polymerase sigma factor RpoD/SigA [Candidatus Falkowbacteria bacterium]MDD2633135.1 RNA polymerase sigma factor RpoD/SigA [Bacteroidales bacterium]MDD4177778.1 RNA polymerase sigma factor RpoD/SigA [Bacteroidales bacterium]MDD4742150.1 RNA polymerase sigma factor RpoD/SigA [Bacteroidales bacterium]